MKNRGFIVVSICLLFIFLVTVPGNANNLSLQTTTFISVGEGDSALLSDGNGFTALIDGGEPSAGQTVDLYLHSLGISHLNVVMASHADSDHIGGLIAILQDSSITVDQVVYNGYPGTTATWDSFSNAVTAKGLTLTTVQFPQVLSWGNMTVHIMNPASGLDSPDTNDASIVALIDYGTTDYLFTGDISDTIEATVVARGTLNPAEILKVAHHGSAYSSSSSFLSAVAPQQAIISVGPNSYGHPSPQTISRLTHAGANVWRTDISGNITVSTDGTTYNVVSLNGTVNLFVFLPFIVKDFPSIVTPTATSVTVVPPPSGINVVCNNNGNAQICAWVSNGSPVKYSTVTVYGRLLINGIGASGQTMTATWHYKSTTPTCTGSTNETGNASCSRSIGSATSGYQVNVDVNIAGQSATTWFTPK